MKAITNVKGIIKENSLNNFNQNEYGYDINFTIVDESNIAADLTSYTTIALQAKSISGTSLKVNGTCSIVNATLGTCKYTVVATDFDEIGLYKSELDLITATSKEIIKLGMFAVDEDLV